MLFAMSLMDLILSQRFFKGSSEWIILFRNSWLMRVLTLRMTSLMFLMALLCLRVRFWFHMVLSILLFNEALGVNQIGTVGIIGFHSFLWLNLLSFTRVGMWVCALLRGLMKGLMRGF